MEQLDVATPSSMGDTSMGDTSAPGRFPCPACGSMLRTGAILCPYCDVKLWKLSQDDPEPLAETVAQPLGGGPAPDAISVDGQRALFSLIIAAIALGARILLPVMARQAPQLSSLLSALAWGTTLLAVYAVYLARQAENRIDGTRDRRGRMVARCGLILGMATIAYTASSFVTSSIDRVISGLQS